VSILSSGHGLRALWTYFEDFELFGHAIKRSVYLFNKEVTSSVRNDVRQGRFVCRGHTLTFSNKRKT
jgi:hypothetical protein